MKNVRDQLGEQNPGRGWDASPRFNVLLTEDRPDSADAWTRQLPRLMGPMGVAAYVAQSGQQAIELAARVRFHAVVIDTSTPRGTQAPPAGSAGHGEPAIAWLSELLHRTPRRPPVVLVQGPAYSDRLAARALHQALRLGVFTVLTKPVTLEQVLAVFRRVLEREYRGNWPAEPAPPTGDPAQP
jgi:CheY-like chemotaxis protein